MKRQITAEAPSYAPDGSRGYMLTITGAGRLSGWIRVGDDGHTVLATVDHAPWKAVGTVDTAAELTPSWVNENADSILELA